MSIRMSPNSREVIGAISTITGQQEYLKSTNHALNVSLISGGSVGLFTIPYDEIDATYPDSTHEVYVSKLSGVTQQTVTITYTDSTKNFISTVVRT